MYFASKLKKLREEHGYLQRQIASLLEIDTPMYSRIERGERIAKEDFIPILAKYFNEDPKQLRQLWLADKIYDVLNGEEQASEVLNMVAEDFQEYGIIKKDDPA